MKFGASWNQLAVWVITVVGNQYANSGNPVTLVTIFTKAKKLKSVKQQLKVFSLRFRQFDILYWTGLQNKCSAAINTGQMMVISIHRTIECFTCWKISTSHQSFLLQSTKMSIYRCQAHIERALDQVAMKHLTTDLICTIMQFLQNLFLTISKVRVLFDHSPALRSRAYNNISLLMP